MTPRQVATAVNKLLLIDIRTKNREIDFVKARALYYYVCRKIDKRWTFLAIGQEIGVDHATVLHGVKMYNQNYCFYYPELKNYAEFLINHFKKNDIEETKKIEEELDLYLFLKNENEFLKVQLAFEKQNKNRFRISDKIEELLEKSPKKDLIIERLEALINMESKKIYL